MTQQPTKPIRRQVDDLLAVLQQTPSEAACAHCLAHLDDYVQAQLNGRSYRTDYPTIAPHLDACEECATSYAHLYTLLHAEQRHALPQPPTIPTPDLSFLPPMPTLAAALQTAVQRTTNRLILQMNETLRILLTPPPTPQLAVRSANQRYSHCLLQLPADTNSIPVTIAAYADQQNPNHCLLELTIAPPGRSWPDLAGSQITLSTPHATPQTAVTDEWGAVSFPHLPIAALGQLRLEIDLSVMRNA